MNIKNTRKAKTMLRNYIKLIKHGWSGYLISENDNEISQMLWKVQPVGIAREK